MTPQRVTVAANGRPPVRKTLCPVSREQFRAHARKLSCHVGDEALTVPTKEFSTGSLGWYYNGKIILNVGDTPVTVQVGLTLTVVGSKELPA